MSFSLKRIKTPTRGLLSMHPFVDVLEGRSLFTAAAHDGLLEIKQVVDVPSSEHSLSPWSSTSIGTDLSADVIEDPALELARQTSPHQFELKPDTTDAAFSTAAIDDSPWALFGNALHDRRGRYEPQEIPSDEAIAAARDSTVPDDPVFATARSMSGAMAPFMTMTAAQQNHPFAG